MAIGNNFGWVNTIKNDISFVKTSGNPDVFDAARVILIFRKGCELVPAYNE